MNDRDRALHYKKLLQHNEIAITETDENIKQNSINIVSDCIDKCSGLNMRFNDFGYTVSECVDYAFKYLVMRSDYTIDNNSSEMINNITHDSYTFKQLHIQQRDNALSKHAAALQADILICK